MADYTQNTLPPLVSEDEIMKFFGRRVNKGYYSNVFDLLDDFCLIVYPQLNKYHHSNNFFKLKDITNRIRTYIHHYYKLFETEKEIRVLFDNMWRFYFKLPYAKKCIKTICPGIVLTADGTIKEIMQSNAYE